MFKRALILLLLLSPFLGGASCEKGDKFRNGANFLGVVELGPFPKQGPGVAGYNLYMSEKKDSGFERINGDGPVSGGAKLMVPMLNPGQDYFFRMTSVSQKDATKESVPGAVFKRTAGAKKDE